MWDTFLWRRRTLDPELQPDPSTYSDHVHPLQMISCHVGCHGEYVHVNVSANVGHPSLPIQKNASFHKHANKWIKHIYLKTKSSVFGWFSTYNLVACNEVCSIPESLQSSDTITFSLPTASLLLPVLLSASVIMIFWQYKRCNNCIEVLRAQSANSGLQPQAYYILCRIQAVT
jgi:hypothetical protein